jgi:hypothetical protein
VSDWKRLVTKDSPCGSAARFGDCQRDGCATCNGAPATCPPRSYGGSHHVQLDQLRERQAVCRVAVPRVRLCPTSNPPVERQRRRRSPGLVAETTAAALSPPANSIRSPLHPPHVRDPLRLIRWRHAPPNLSVDSLEMSAFKYKARPLSSDGYFRSGSFTLICSPVLSGGSAIHNGP